MPKTNTQNPNEQNRNTNTPNGANYTNPLQNEFENSATYRVIHKVGDKVTESVNNRRRGEDFPRGAGCGERRCKRSGTVWADTVNRKFNTNARTNYQSPQGQNPDVRTTIPTRRRRTRITSARIQTRIRLRAARPADRIIRRAAQRREIPFRRTVRPCSSRKKRRASRT